MSEHLLEYEIDLYSNRFRMGVPSRFVERAEELLTDGAFAEFLEHVREGTYSTAASALAKAVKDNGAEITDEVRGLHRELRSVRLKGDKDFIPDFAGSVRERALFEAGLGIQDPERLAELERKLERVLDTERLLVRAADKAGVSAGELELYIREALKEIETLTNVL